MKLAAAFVVLAPLMNFAACSSERGSAPSTPAIACATGVPVESSVVPVVALPSPPPAATPTPPGIPAEASSAVAPPAAEIPLFKDGHCLTPRRKTFNPPNAGDAIAAFRRAWSSCVVMNGPPGRVDVHFTTASMDRSEHPFRARKEACGVVKKRLEHAMTGLVPELVVFGTLADVGDAAECWTVSYEGGMKNEVEGVLNAAGLDLLFAWKIPEG